MSPPNGTGTYSRGERLARSVGEVFAAKHLLPVYFIIVNRRMVVSRGWAGRRAPIAQSCSHHENFERTLRLSGCFAHRLLGWLADGIELILITIISPPSVSVV